MFFKGVEYITNTEVCLSNNIRTMDGKFKFDCNNYANTFDVRYTFNSCTLQVVFKIKLKLSYNMNLDLV